MDYSSEEPQANKSRPQHKHEHKASTTELLANAQLLAGAAFNQKGADKAKLSEAAEEILAAGEDYGKLGEGSYGGYIEKAEGFLHKYHASESDHGTGNSNAGKTTEEESGNTRRAARPAKYDLELEEESGNTERAARPAKYDLEEESGNTRRAARPAKYDLEEEESGNTRRAARPAKYGYDQEEESGKTEHAARPAKNDLEEESESGGGFGGYMKMAQGFLKN